VIAAGLGLTAALCWGTFDYLGSLRSRQLTPLWMLTVSQGIAFAGSAVAVAIAGTGPPPLGEALLAIAAGLAYTVSLAAFFRAVTVTRISVVAPISAGGAAIPVLAGILSGDDPGTAGLLGIAITLTGVCALCVATPGEDSPDIAPRLGVVLGLVSALGTGLYFLGIDLAATDDVLWTLAIVSGVAFATLAAAVRLRRGADVPPGGRVLAPLILPGCFVLAGGVAYAFATTLGELSVVVVLAALYPAIPALLAWLLLGERLRRVQQLGAAAALIGVGLMAL
jgi:drug/metabolite transporter (DMT)-like permease